MRSLASLMLMIVLIATVAVALAWPQRAFAQGAKKYAVCVGVRDYPTIVAGNQQHNMDCHVTDKDAEVIAAMLRQQGYTEVVLLTNRQATLSSVRSAIQKTGAKCGSADTFAFFFSGHGQQVPDRNGDEGNDTDQTVGVDEALVLSHASSSIDANRVMDLLYIDDMFNEDISRIKAGTILLLLDSCYSGGAAKTINLFPKSNPVAFSQESFTQEYYKAVRDRAPGLVRSDASNAQPPSARAEDFGADVSSNSHVVCFTASRYDEYSWEGETLSMFSAALAQVFSTCCAEADSNKDMFVSFKEGGAFIQNTVQRLTGNAQHPTFHIGSDVSGTTWFKIPAPETWSRGDMQNLIRDLECNGQTGSPKYQLKATIDKSAYSVGDAINLNVAIDKQAYLYLLAFWGDKSASILIPYEGMSSNKFASGKYTVPDLTDGARLELLQGTKPGTEYLIVIASPVKLAFKDALAQSKVATPGQMKGDYADLQYGVQGLSSLLLGGMPAGLVRDEQKQPSLAAVLLEYKAQ